ncbi:MAG: outer membrane protein assembly factor BamE [Oleibacter sp.]|nr:outer membrane protein assembly factor BamE [Thalassolituus sp.]
MQRIILTALLGFATITVTGCAFPGVYKLNIQQGNIVKPDMLAQLEPGMTSNQVIYVMGNPVLNDPFTDRSWDYIYTLEQRDKITKRYHITLFFDEQGGYTHYTGELPVEDIKGEDQSETLPAGAEQLPTSAPIEI